jgi:hypothetical protein
LLFFKKEGFHPLFYSIILTNLFEKGKILQLLEVYMGENSQVFLLKNNSFRMKYFSILKTKYHKKLKNKDKKKNWLDAC